MITITPYDTCRQNLLRNPFADESYVYAAQLVSDGYTFSSAHTTRSSVGNFLGAPLRLSSKSISYTGDNTFLDCADLDFKTTQGTIDAAYCIIHLMNTGSPLTTDKLICCINFNSGEMESVSNAIKLSTCGLLAIQREQ